MATITIPDTTAETMRELEGVSALLHAKTWERAALIATLVGPPTGSGRRKKSSMLNFSYTPDTLAALHLQGLRSKATVIYYRDQWCKHRPVPHLGDTVDLDGLPEWEGQGTANTKKAAAKTPGSLTYAHKSNRPSSVTEPYGTGSRFEDDVTRLADRSGRDLLRAAERREERDDKRSEGDDARTVRLAPERETDEQKALRLVVTAFVNIKQDLTHLLKDSLPSHIGDLHPSSVKHFWSMVEEVETTLREHRMEYTQEQDAG